MALTRTKFDVAFIDDKGTEQEHQIEVWAVDEMRAEMEARRIGLRGSVVDSDSGVITDLGDIRNRQGLEVWAALTRLGLYTGKAMTFRREHLIAVEKVKVDPVAVDPTQPEASTASD